jgi:hypothetical protein
MPSHSSRLFLNLQIYRYFWHDPNKPTTNVENLRSPKICAVRMRTAPLRHLFPSPLHLLSFCWNEIYFDAEIFVRHRCILCWLIFFIRICLHALKLWYFCQMTSFPVSSRDTTSSSLLALFWVQKSDATCIVYSSYSYSVYLIFCTTGNA